jgi:ubiquinone biosynthesis protein COQ9
MSTPRDTLLLEVLREVPFTGFSDASLKAAAVRAGSTPAEAAALFPEGGASLVEAFSHWADREMAEHMRLEAPQRVRERIARAVRLRIGALTAHREAARRAAAFLALPAHAPLAAKLLFDSVDAMWRAAGDRSSDFSYYTKRALLAGVYAATLAYWLTDSSEESAETWAFLDARIDDVMKIQKLRSDLDEAVAKLPDPFGVLAAMRTRE